MDLKISLKNDTETRTKTYKKDETEREETRNKTKTKRLPKQRKLTNKQQSKTQTKTYKYHMNGEKGKSDTEQAGKKTQAKTQRSIQKGKRSRSNCPVKSWHLKTVISRSSCISCSLSEFITNQRRKESLKVQVPANRLSLVYSHFCFISFGRRSCVSPGIVFQAITIYRKKERT